MRAFGAAILKGASSRCSSTFSLQRSNLLSKGLTSASSDSIQEVKDNNSYQLRMILRFPPVCMGRRSSKIAGRKCEERWSKSNVNYCSGRYARGSQGT
ncbi:Transcriptional regulator TACO1-like [Quillaja saponaria]|uniref:Transcriptional regulator TACO1-like n=1 Tax=Quillaja saponaria TaxID=32244 RepID=A0AAD7LK65_QUISA|nr:Transcriptional regulator TACO1-like [Quillaja saponaria]